MYIHTKLQVLYHAIQPRSYHTEKHVGYSPFLYVLAFNCDLELGIYYFAGWPTRI